VLLSGTSEDVYIAKLAPNGSHLWSQRFVNDYAQDVSGVSVAPNGHIFIAGAEAGTLQIGATPLVSAGGTDGYWVELDPNGTPVASARYGAGYDDRARSIALGPGGNLVLGGEFAGVIDFGDGAHSSVSNSQDLFVAKLTAAGAPMWSQTFRRWVHPVRRSGARGPLRRDPARGLL